jgi:hypothetical protein
VTLESQKEEKIFHSYSKVLQMTGSIKHFNRPIYHIVTYGPFL